MVCPICGAAVSNPRASSHVKSKKHQSALAKLGKKNNRSINEIEYQLIDIYECNNLEGGVLQNLPAYLTVSFNIEREAKYTFIVVSPDGDITGTTSDWARPGFNFHWRVPFLEHPGSWKIEIHLFFDHPVRTIREVIPVHLPSELFDYSSDDEREDNYLAELNIPAKDEIQHVDVTSRFPELDAHWLQVDPELKIWRYIYQLDDKEGMFVPILLIHGFHSDFTTWNYLVRYLWADGFRNLFAMDLYDYRLGVERNAQHLEKVIDEILDLTNRKSLYIIGHSLGGLVGRYYVKKFDPRKVQLLVTIASPHMPGLSRFPVFFTFRLIDRKAKDQMSHRDLTVHPKSAVKQTQKISTEADLYLLSMVNICGTKFRGGDTGFKLKDNLVPDMVNLGVKYIHTTVHKNQDTYRILRNLILGKSIIYKIRLLYITPTVESPKKIKMFLLLKPKDKKDYQRYPFEGFIELGNEPYIPQIPMIIFTYLRDEEDLKTERLDVQILDKKKKILAEGEFIVPLGDKEQVSDHFSLDMGTGYSIQFAVYSYRLLYESDSPACEQEK
ncbi:MAG: esterase/lipase family protein [Candidatus Odinarchaeota archaeon]